MREPSILSNPAVMSAPASKMFEENITAFDEFYGFDRESVDPDETDSTT